jgi:hypothetical protein
MEKNSWNLDGNKMGNKEILHCQNISKIKSENL